MPMTTDEIKQLIVSKANQYGVPSDLALAVARKESDYDPNARSSVGAVGLFQLMPTTAADLGVNPYIVTENVDGGIRYLAQMYRKFGSWDLALGAYNAGPGNVQKYGGIPPFKETKNYVETILGWLGFGGSENRGPFKTVGETTYRVVESQRKG